MDKLIGVILVVVFGGAGLIAIIMIVNLLLPAPVRRTRLALEASLGRSLLLGIVNFLFAGVLVALLLWPTRIGGAVAGIFVFLAGLAALAAAALILLGLAALTGLLEERMGKTKSSAPPQLRGGLLILLACLTPYFGWFVITPLLLWTAMGAAVAALFRRNDKAA
jgi:hypothetical protein